MKTFLDLYEINIDKVYPRVEFNKDVEDLLPFGLLIALIELRLVTTSVEDDAMLSGSIFGAMEVPGSNSLFRIRVKDVVQEFVDNGVLDKLATEINRKF